MTLLPPRRGSLLTVVLIPLFLVPENYSIAGPLKSVGYPPMLAGLACLVVWIGRPMDRGINARADAPVAMDDAGLFRGQPRRLRGSHDANLVQEESGLRDPARSSRFSR